MSIPENHPAIVQAKKFGLIEEHHPLRDVVAEANATAALEQHLADNTKLAESSVFMDGATLTAILPVLTKSETNQRKWREKHRRSGESWKAVSRTIGPHLSLLVPFAKAYHADKALRVVFTRLGCRKMDKSNLPAAMKGVEDAVAFMLGADDGDPRWHPSFDQDTAYDGVGVCVSISILG